MSLQFILGPSGAGKSHYIYNKIINDSMTNPETNYILLVPEQYSLALQRKMVTLHPRGGSMNIDVIGFNRLSYRIFDELNIKPGKVLEDFGKTMLIRQVAGEVKEQLSVFSNNLDKSGFIDEVKSIMSEIYQYNLDMQSMEQTIERIKETGDKLLADKLHDICIIIKAFKEKISQDFIVAEEIMELLYDNISMSKLIANSVICLDGFTGFTPIQLKVVGQLMCYSKKIYSLHTIDRKSYDRAYVGEHEIFYLTKNTVNKLGRLADSFGISIEKDMFIQGDTKNRWKTESFYNEELAHLEENLFRYPYNKYTKALNNISVTAYENPRKELIGVAQHIKELVVKKGYRYKDIAIISGDLEGMTAYVDQILPTYDIPYFLDYKRPLKNNPYIDSINHLFRIVEEGFSYDSVFAFLKAGIIDEMSTEQIETLENFVLARGVRGFKYWNTIWDDEADIPRQIFMDKIVDFYNAVSGKTLTIEEYVEALHIFMDKMNYEKAMSETKGLYDKICSLLQKMKEILGLKKVDIGEFAELIDLGIKDLGLGMIPGKIDMVTVGDITRTRLEDIKALFVVGVNEGIIPRKSTPSQIISDRDKEALSNFNFELAPTEKMNTFIEQFYLYINLTKPSHRLYVSYTNMNGATQPIRSSYFIGRLTNIFSKLKVEQNRGTTCFIATPEAAQDYLIEGLWSILLGEKVDISKVYGLYKVYEELGYTHTLQRIVDAMTYMNVPKHLSDEVKDLIRLNLASVSVSRLEQYSNCAYSYYLKYILGLREREIRAIDNLSTGNILHTAMERLYRHVYDNMKNDWSAIKEEERDELVERFIDYAYDKEYNGKIIDEGKYQYLRTILKRIGKRTAKTLVNISGNDKFAPVLFEHRFTKEITLHDGTKVNLVGVVDRGDVYYDSVENKLKIKIIDYKSSEHNFKLNEVFEGLQLQLSVYMQIVTELMDETYNKTGEHKVEILPEGMYYYQMKDPYVKGDTAVKAEQKREKEFVLKGFEAINRESFDKILEYAMCKVKDISKNILSGNIEKRPIKHENNTACKWCPFASVCRFDARGGINSYKYYQFKNTDNENIYIAIDETLGGEANAMD
ncbi:MAG: hypothetical protein E7258_00715 [Lachnospiraceae bacterium]|nr:hypothetical protein [Lachnospiraceae bacterium]